MENKTLRLAKTPTPKQPVTISSTELFGNNTRIQIKHQGQLYQLAITRYNKLILTK